MERIRDRYEPIEVIGEGGQGRVIRARDRIHDRIVVLKARRVSVSGDERDRVLSEARILLGLDKNPGLPTVRDDFFEGDLYYLVMDWIDGRPLSQVLSEEGAPGLPISTVIRYVAQVAETLDRLHHADPPVYHLDVKPANIILTDAGRAVLVDLGISSLRGGPHRSAGTDGFIAPEIIAGGPPAPAADVFGLAASAFALATGEPPSIGASAEAIPEGAREVFGRGLAVDPADRPGTASGFAQELRHWHEGVDPAASRPAGRSSTRTRLAAIGLAIVLLAGSASAVMLSSDGPQAPGSGGAALPTDVSSPTEGSANAETGQDQRTGGDPSPPSSTSTSPSGSSTAPAGPSLLELPESGTYRFTVSDAEVTQYAAITEERRLRGSAPSTIDVEVSTDANQRSVVMEFAFGAGGSTQSRRLLFRINQRMRLTGERFRIEGCREAQASGTCLDRLTTFDPPLALTPGALERGADIAGTSSGTWGGGARTDVYAGTAVRWETMRAAGASYRVMRITWSDAFTGADAGTHARTLWYSPELGLPIQMTDVFTADTLDWSGPDGGAEPDYESRVTLTLSALP